MTLPPPLITDPDGRLDPFMVQRALDLIAQAFPVQGLNLGGGAIATTSTARYTLALGTSSVTFTAAAQSAEQTVAHGLPATPGFAVVFARPPVVQVCNFFPTTVDGTNLKFKAEENSATAVTGTQNCYWLAIA